MAKPSDDTKKTASSMFSRVGKSALGGAKKVASSVGKLFTKKPENVIPRPSGPTETLGEIFKMMKIMDEDRKLTQEMASAHIEEQKHEKDRRNNEIIKALTARKPPKPPKVKKEKKVEEKKPVEKKVEEKKPPEKKEPEKKVEEKKAPEKKAKESVEKVKEEKKTKETAEKTKEKETKKTKESAEKVKQEETKKSQEAAKTTAKKEEKPAEVIPQVVKKVPPITGTDSEIKKMIMQHEGKVNFPYKDSKGLWTIGVGHLINGHGKTLPPEYAAYKDNGAANDKKNNRTPAMTDEQINELFEKDYVKHKEIAMKTPGWSLANENGQSAMIDLSYNMGEWFNTKEWRNSNAVKALKAGNFESAADHLKDSLWYQQVKGRAVKIVNMMRNGKKTDAEMAKTIPASSTSGTSLDQSSKENADGKKELNAQQAQSQQNINVINQNVSQPEQNLPPKPNDTNPLLAKVKGQPK